MLVRLFAVALIAAAPAAALAQERQFGAKVGPAFTGIALSDDDGQRYHPRIAALAGGFFALPVAPRFALQIEAMSSPKGTRVELSDPGYSETLEVRYFEVPVLARLNGPKAGPGVVYVLAGPFFGIRTSAKARQSTVINSMGVGVREDASEAIERFESGLIVAAGLDIGKHLLVERRYAHGLTNVSRIPDASFTNRGLSFTLGARF